LAKTQDLCEIFANYAASVLYDDLPNSAVDGAKKSILDTAGVILAASGMEPAVQGVISFVKEGAGRPEASVLGFGLRVPAAMAAFANGAMAHCLDYDDQTPWGQHSASSLIPAVFAVSERVGRVSGKEMITAVAIGQDMFNRLRRHVDWQKDWMFSTVMGVYCAAAASARILALPPDRIANALGIAGLQSCGMAEVVNSTGSDLRALYAGFPAKGAVMAAILAEKGVTGLPSLFEGRYGVLPLYFGGRYDRQGILEGLGRDFTGGLTLYKRWPAVGTAHSHIHATIEMVRENDLKPTDIAQIRVFVGDYHKLMCEPFETRRSPKTLVDAKFSLPYLVAIAVVRRGMSLADFAAEALASPEILAVAERVTPVNDPTLDWKLDLPAGRVEIVARDGRRFEKVGTDIPGSVDAPMAWDQIVSKFEDCAASGLAPLARKTVVEVCGMARKLEAMEDATEFLRLMS
jgi:2-methylcitrate dehydratase PrpD